MVYLLPFLSYFAGSNSVSPAHTMTNTTLESYCFVERQKSVKHSLPISWLYQATSCRLIEKLLQHQRTNATVLSELWLLEHYMEDQKQFKYRFQLTRACNLFDGCFALFFIISSHIRSGDSIWTTDPGTDFNCKFVYCGWFVNKLFLLLHWLLWLGSLYHLTRFHNAFSSMCLVALCNSGTMAMGEVPACFRNANEMESSAVNGDSHNLCRITYWRSNWSRLLGSDKGKYHMYLTAIGRTEPGINAAIR